jgi:PTS system galactitol-specific IIA component
MLWEEFKKEMILQNLKLSSREELFKTLGGVLIKNGFCKESFVAALVKREAENPTGIDMDGFGVAIPHSDPSHVIKDGLAVGVLDAPVTFTAMGTDDEYVDAQIAFVLAITDPDSHLDKMQALLRVIQDKETLRALKNARGPEDFIEIIKNKEGSKPQP